MKKGLTTLLLFAICAITLNGEILIVEEKEYDSIRLTSIITEDRIKVHLLKDKLPDNVGWIGFSIDDNGELIDLRPVKIATFLKKYPKGYEIPYDVEGRNVRVSLWVGYDKKTKKMVERLHDTGWVSLNVLNKIIQISPSISADEESSRADTPSPTFTIEQTFGSLEVSAQTSGKLYLDGKLVGRIPAGAKAKLDNISVGQHDLEMRYGDQTEERSVRVRENRSLAVAFSWVERPDVPEGYVLVEGGTFRMGSTDGGRDEKPVHSVTVGSFYMKATEVTQKEWREVMGSNPSYFKGDDLPVENVSWYDAVKYCNALSKKEGRTPVYRINGSSVTANWSADGYRLPTEAEWEYAARGGKNSRGYKYSGSNSVDGVGWYWKNSGDKPLDGQSDFDAIEQNKGRTHPVGQKQANELGLYDMSGNVLEWCWDWYGGYSSGPSSGLVRVFRGGSWLDNGWVLRSAARNGVSPGRSSDNLGFRLAFRT